jgi:hypothetical protein
VRLYRTDNKWLKPLARDIFLVQTPPPPISVSAANKGLTAISCYLLQIKDLRRYGVHVFANKGLTRHSGWQT